MAKGQKRSSKEIRKPKQDKKPVKVEATLGLQIKPTSSGAGASKKSK